MPAFGHSGHRSFTMICDLSGALVFVMFIAMFLAQFFALFFALFLALPFAQYLALSFTSPSAYALF